MDLGQLTQCLQVLHGQQLAVRAQQGTGITQFHKGLGWQLVQCGFVDAEQAGYVLLACVTLHLDGPGLDEIVLLQQDTDPLVGLLVGGIRTVFIALNLSIVGLATIFLGRHRWPFQRRVYDAQDTH